MFLSQIVDIIFWSNIVIISEKNFFLSFLVIRAVFDERNISTDNYEVLGKKMYFIIKSSYKHISRPLY